MHSFEAYIWISQHENSDVHQGEAEVNITFKGRLILVLTENNKAPTVMLYDTACLAIPSFI